MAASCATIAQLRADVRFPLSLGIQSHICLQLWEIRHQHELAHLQLKDSRIANTTLREHLGQSQSDLKAREEEAVAANDTVRAVTLYCTLSDHRSRLRDRHYSARTLASRTQNLVERNLLQDWMMLL